MTHAVELDLSGDFVRVVTEGDFSEEGYRAMVDEILSRPYWRPGMRVLFDHRELSFADSTFDLMQRASGYHLEQDARIGDGRAAVVVAQVADFGSARQFEALIHDEAEARVRIFRDMDPAMEWLLEEV